VRAAKWVRTAVVCSVGIVPLGALASAAASATQSAQRRPNGSAGSLGRLINFNLRGRSFKYNINGYMSAPDSSQASVIGTGRVDTRSKSVQVGGTLGIPPAGYGLSASSNLAGKKATFNLIETSQAEFIGGTLFQSLLPPGAKWASLQYAKLSQGAAASADSVPNIEDNMYPMLEILGLPGPGVTVSRSSSGMLDGSELRYFKASIQSAELVDRINASSLPQSEKFRITSVLGWSTITCYTGFDSSGRLRQVNDLASTSFDGVTLKLDMVENASTWIHPATIFPPPASEVFDRTPSVDSGADQLDPGNIQTV
jgi:hypothetical protein